ncbi:MAG: hypothetical protein CL522_03035 [Actinobacteria bacterium]|nr:hypothetical protein [Actinomycetota bacterium]
MGREKLEFTNSVILLLGCMALFITGSCASADSPSLSAVPAQSEATVAPPEIGQETSEESDISVQESSNEIETEQEKIVVEEVIPSTRGVSDTSVRIGIIKTGDVFSDVELGVEARISRVQAEDDTNAREIEIVQVIDDGGDPQRTLEAAQSLANQDVFAIVLASVAADRTVTNYLAEQNIPFFGWGFLEGFCYPNKWGFGFNGCLNGHALNISGATVDDGSLRLSKIFYGRQPTMTLVTTSDAAGDAMEATVNKVWGDNLVAVVRIPPTQNSGIAESILEGIGNVDSDMLWLSIGLGKTLQVKAQLISAFSGMVVDDVTYLPGILREYETSKELEGGYVFTQFPPQEEYREAATLIATDLQNINGPLIYSQAISLGYWSTDFLMHLLDQIGEELDTRTFFNVANIQGTVYSPNISGGPCALMTALVHQDPSGGLALLQVRGGVFRPVVDFDCPERYWEN